MGLYPRPETRGIGLRRRPEGHSGTGIPGNPAGAKRSIRRLVVSLPGKKAVSQIVDDKTGSDQFPGG
jgi:hypothetical protein